MKGIKWTAVFTACLVGFTIYIALDTFVLPGSYQRDASKMALSLFETEAAQTAAETEDPAAETEAADVEANDPDQTEKSEDSGQEQSDVKQPDRERPERKQPGGEHPDGRRPEGNRNKEGSNAEESVTLENSVSEKSYQDDNIKIELTEYTTNDTTVYVADVTLSSAQYLKTALANDLFGKNITDEVSDIAEAHSAVLAINGDYYGAREKGIVIRNGIVYRETQSDAELLCIYADGSMTIEDQSSVTAQELVDAGVWQAFSFGPALVVDGEVAVDADEEVGLAKASNPRTAIGIIDDLHYVFVVSDGRTEESEGLSLQELAVLMKELGATCAYNLDGGGSSTMVFEGEVINNPTSGGAIKERKVSDIVYIGA